MPELTEAVDRLTTEVRRVADALTTPADDATTTADDGQYPGYETVPNRCGCPCEGCRHHCGAHQPADDGAAHQLRAESRARTLRRVRDLLDRAEHHSQWVDSAALRFILDTQDPEPTNDAPDDGLTPEEAREEVERLARELYLAQDGLAFVREMCDVADREGIEVTTAAVRGWLTGPKCARVLATEQARGQDPDDGLREQYAEAIRTAAFYCDGDCGMAEADCLAAHLIQVGAWTFGVVSDVSGPPGALADAVLAGRDREMEQLAADRDASDEAARRALDQRQEMAAERYEWQQRGDRAEAAIARVRDIAADMQNITGARTWANWLTAALATPAADPTEGQ